MTIKKITELAEALASAGYEIANIDTFYNTELIDKYGSIEIFLLPISKVKNPFAKEIIIKLLEAASSLDYGIVKYELLCRKMYGDIKLVFQKL